MEAFEENCRGCKPAMIDTRTMKALPDDNPAMQAIFKVWDGLTLAERQAWHRVTCLNSRVPSDLATMQKLSNLFGAAAQAAGGLG